MNSLTVINTMTKEEEAEVLELKNNLASLKCGEELVYYTGVTPNEFDSRFVKEKMRAVYGAYYNDLITPLQRVVPVQRVARLTEFEYIAVGR